ncbi:hypothetical protein FACS1894208_05000 [Clostridia bacterium]|nr:hypothetical protein FACS1894208_05000 [Clostridia bacterium]
MQYRDLCGEKVSLLGFGAMRLDLSLNGIKQSEEILDYYVGHGGNYFDTAYLYQGGKSERFLGNALRKHSRESYYLATKLPPSRIKSMSDLDGLIGTQLSRLQTDYIDFFLLHNIHAENYPLVQRYGLYELLREKQKAGVIRRLGFSFHDKPNLLREIVEKYNFDFAQIQMNYMDWTVQDAKYISKALSISSCSSSVIGVKVSDVNTKR